MKEIILITLIGNLKEFIITLLVVLIVVLVMGVFAFVVFDKEDNETLFVKRHIKKVLTALFFTALFNVFIPSKKDLYLILGLGTTIDYVKSSKEIKELPENVAKTLNHYLLKLTEEEDSTKDKKGLKR